MSIKFASICPHPPIIIPTIGSSSDLRLVSKTIQAMKELADIFAKSKPETIIIISPHGPVSYDEMTITISPTLLGNFQDFGDYKTKLNFENDLEIVDALQKRCKKEKIPVRIMNSPQLDHGSLIPLYYLTKNYTPPEGRILKVVPIAYSYLSPKTHLEFGKKIFEICNIEGKTKSKRIAVIASGDLSHRLSLTSPAGFSMDGVRFDKKISSLLRREDIKGILNIDSDLIKDAGECGYLSITTLLGVLSKIKGFKIKLLSYQKPFGVGYLVANVKL